MGEVILTVTLNGITKKLIAYVLKNTDNLFGTDWIEKFNLWHCPMSTFCRNLKSPITNTEKLKQECKQKFPEVFSGSLEKCTKMKAQFQVKDHAQPIFKKKRNVPFAALEQIDEELDRLEKAGILSKTDFSKWAVPTVYVRKKSNQLRVCADFSTGLNQALKDHLYPLPSPEEKFNKLNGGKIFSKIDLSDAYYQIEVEENSCKLLCINTHRGLYKFNRLAFGVEVVPAIFQQVMDAMLGNLDFATAYLDDILITSKSVTEHRKHITCIFDKLQEYGFKVKEAKCNFFLTQIKYLGHIINKDIRRMDPDRATTIKDMLAPDNIQALQSFLGLANFYQVFIKNMHNLRAPLNELLKKDKTWS